MANKQDEPEPVKDLPPPIGDTTISEEDSAKTDAAASQPVKNPKSGKFAWLKNKKVAIPLGILGALVLLLIVAILTPLKYPLFNLVSKTEASVTVVDAEKGQPVSSASVSLAGKTAETDKDGKATLSGLKHGKSNLKVTKAAYRESNTEVTLGWKRNDLGKVKLTATGISIELNIVNQLSGKPAGDVEVSYQDSTATSDDEGKAVLVVPPTDEKMVKVTTKGDGYLEKEVEIAVDARAVQEVKVVPAGKDYFFSNRDGKINLYSSNLDGSEQTVILQGSGNESKNISLSISPDGKWAAIVSTRDNKRDGNGNLQPSLFVFNLHENKLTSADEGASSFSLQGWANGRVVYEVVKDDLPYDNNERYKVKTYNPETKQLSTLSKNNYLNVHAVISNQIFYSRRNYNEKDQFYRVNPDGTGEKKITPDNVQYVSQVTQQSPDVIVFSAWDGSKYVWFQYSFKTGSASVLSGEPSDLTNRRTIPSPSGNKVIWVEDRDGQGHLLAADASGENQKSVTSKPGLNYPLRWIGDDYVVFRVSNSQETANYVVALDGGQPLKISDVFVQSYNYGPYF